MDIIVYDGPPELGELINKLQTRVSCVPATLRERPPHPSLKNTSPVQRTVPLKQSTPNQRSWDFSNTRKWLNVSSNFRIGINGILHQSALQRKKQ